LAGHFIQPQLQPVLLSVPGELPQHGCLRPMLRRQAERILRVVAADHKTELDASDEVSFTVKK
jgi:hypothetical protein